LKSLFGLVTWKSSCHDVYRSASIHCSSGTQNNDRRIHTLCLFSGGEKSLYYQQASMYWISMNPLRSEPSSSVYQQRNK
jgi:hypothetical protein